MSAILAIDAAWTSGQPSGVALVASDKAEWRCIAVAPSYESFVALGSGRAVNWHQPRFSSELPDIAQLLSTAQLLAKAPIELVTVDMPLSTVAITGRRRADDAVSREFGGRGCSAHTPSLTRPGPLGAALSAGFRTAGFPIATVDTCASLRHQLIEVYPHPGLLALLDRPYRVPYKVAKTHRYWPSAPRAKRIVALLLELSAIREGLLAVFGSVGIPLPTSDNVLSFNALKRFEDALDALVCAWVGVCHLQRNTTPLGDDTAAIWCPKKSLGSQGSVAADTQFEGNDLTWSNQVATRS